MEVPPQEDARDAVRSEFVIGLSPLGREVGAEVDERTERDLTFTANVATVVAAVPRTVPIHDLQVQRVAKEVGSQGPEACWKPGTFEEGASTPQNGLIAPLDDGVGFMDVGGRLVVQNAKGRRRRFDLPASVGVQQADLLRAEKMLDGTGRLHCRFVRKGVACQELGPDVVDGKTNSSIIADGRVVVPAIKDDVVARDDVTKADCIGSTPRLVRNACRGAT